jgi:hypothetical protein
LAPLGSSKDERKCGRTPFPKQNKVYVSVLGQELAAEPYVMTVTLDLRNRESPSKWTRAQRMRSAWRLPTNAAGTQTPTREANGFSAVRLGKDYVGAARNSDLPPDGLNF